MSYEYYTEAVALDEKMLGKTTARSKGIAAGVAMRFNELAQSGWEFVAMAPVPVTGKVRKSKEYREITIAVFRKTRE